MIVLFLLFDYFLVNLRKTIVIVEKLCYNMYKRTGRVVLFVPIPQF